MGWPLLRKGTHLWEGRGERGNNLEDATGLVEVPDAAIGN
jgi:hypothetical protein